MPTKGKCAETFYWLLQEWRSLRVFVSAIALSRRVRVSEAVVGMSKSDTCGAAPSEVWLRRVWMNTINLNLTRKYLFEPVENVTFLTFHRLYKENSFFRRTQELPALVLLQIFR